MDVEENEVATTETRLSDSAKGKLRWPWIACASALGLVAFYPWLLWVVSQKRGDLEDVFFEPTVNSPFLVCVLAAFLFWRRKAPIRGAIGAPPQRVLSLVLAATSISLQAWSLHIDAPPLQGLGLIAAIGSMAAWLGGTALLRAIAVPTAFLLFAFPPPAAMVNAVMHPLQIFAANAAFAILQIFGADSWIFGDRLVFGNRVFQVIESCSGYRSSLTVSMASILYIDLFYRSRVQAIALFIAAPLIAIAMNTGRVLSIMLNPYAEFATVHEIQGVVAIVLSIFALSALDRLLSHFVPASPRRWPQARRAPSLQQCWVAAGALALLAAMPFTIPSWSEPSRPPAPFLRMPERLGELRFNNLRLDRQYLGSVSFLETLFRSYSDEQSHFEVFVGLDDRLRSERSAISSKTKRPGSGWQLVSSRVVAADHVAPRREELIFRNPQQTMLVWWWVEGVESSLEELGRATLRLDRGASRRSDDVVVFRFQVPIRGPIAETRENLRDFVALSLPTLEIRRETTRS